MPQPREHERLLAKPRHDVGTAFQQLFHSHRRALPRRAEHLREPTHRETLQQPKVRRSHLPLAHGVKQRGVRRPRQRGAVAVRRGGAGDGRPDPRGSARTVAPTDVIVRGHDREASVRAGNRTAAAATATDGHHRALLGENAEGFVRFAFAFGGAVERPVSDLANARSTIRPRGGRGLELEETARAFRARRGGGAELGDGLGEVRAE